MSKGESDIAAPVAIPEPFRNAGTVDMAKAKVDRAALEACLAEIAGGASPVDAAKRHGIGKTRVYDEIAKRRAAPAAATPPVPRRPSAPTPRRGSPPRAPAPVPDRWVEPEDAAPEDEDAPPIEVDASDLERLDRLIAQLERDLETAPIERKGPLSTALRAAIKDAAKMRPRPPATLEELEALAGPDAAEVSGKIGMVVARKEAEAAALGVCLWCRAPLDLLADLRAAREAADPVAALEELEARVAAAHVPAAAPA